MAETESETSLMSLILYIGVIIITLGGALWFSSSGLFLESLYPDGQLQGILIAVGGVIVTVIGLILRSKE